MRCYMTGLDAPPCSYMQHCGWGRLSWACVRELLPHLPPHGCNQVKVVSQTAGLRRCSTPGPGPDTQLQPLI